jgi:small subunit ribosomal protein S4
MVRHATKPGVHGKKRGKPKSEYGTQLREKQNLRISYLLKEKQLSKYFKEVGNKADAGNLILERLERRIDNVVFRLGFAHSRKKAQQMISHGHFMLNGRKITVPSILVKKGDVVTVREQSASNGLFKEIEARLKSATPLSWVVYDSEKKEARVVSLPAKEDLPKAFNMSLVVEYYSR